MGSRMPVAAFYSMLLPLFRTRAAALQCSIECHFTKIIK